MVVVVACCVLLRVRDVLSCCVGFGLAVFVLLCWCVVVFCLFVFGLFCVCVLCCVNAVVSVMVCC